MKFKIIKNEKNGKERYEVYYFNEFDSRGPKWSQVIWNEEAHLNFLANTVEEAEQRARDFLHNHNAEHGAVVREFEII